MTKITVTIIVIVCLCALMVGCAAIKDGFFKKHAVDGPDMEFNYNLLDFALAKQWQDAEGKYFISFTLDKDFQLAMGDDVLVDYKDGGYTHDFNGEELTGRQEIKPDNTDIKLNGEPYAKIKGIWYEADAVYITLEYGDGESEFICFREAIG